VLIAPTAVEWFAEASPKLHTTTESAGHSGVTPSFAARSSANARPTALGRCDAIVDVCGMTARSLLPNTLCRPPEIGSSTAPVMPSSTSRSGVCPGSCADPGQVEPRRNGSAAGPGRSGAARRPPRRCPRARTSRCCRNRRRAKPRVRAARSRCRLPSCASNSASARSAVSPAGNAPTGRGRQHAGGEVVVDRLAHHYAASSVWPPAPRAPSPMVSPAEPQRP